MAVIGANEVSSCEELTKLMENWVCATDRLAGVRTFPENKLLNALMEASEVRLGLVRW